METLRRGGTSIPFSIDMFSWADAELIPNDLLLLRRAWWSFWKNVLPDEPDTHPKTKDVVLWLTAQGMSKRNAEASARMLRPACAVGAGRPMKDEATEAEEAAEAEE
jgi:hypothetical protein